jgi:hypothetical protein
MDQFVTCNVYNSASSILIVGSNDGSVWTTIYNISNTNLTSTGSDQIFGPLITYDLVNNSNTYYNYFRFIVTNPQGQSNLGKVNFSGYALQ